MKKVINRIKTTAIVCAFNEENTIRGVMDTLINSFSIDQVIAVDDGSNDQTGLILNEFSKIEKVEVILLNKNQGKGYAMSEAVERADGEILIFVDADLINLSEEHLSGMLEGFFNENAEMVIGIPVRGRKIKLIEKLIPFQKLSGQRVLLREDFLPLTNSIRFSGYGVETILNLAFQEKGKKIISIFLTNLIHPIKVEKSGFLKSVGEYFIEGKEILFTKLRNPKLVYGSFLVKAYRKLELISRY